MVLMMDGGTFEGGQTHMVVINRTKPHTEFRGAIECGLFKIIVIGGMGKYAAAPWTSG